MPTCLHPKKVYNKLFPCGKCPVCRQNLRQAKGNRFLLASAFNKKAGGSNFFVTLTYRDDAMTFCRAPNSSSGEWFPCFDKHHIKLFFHYLRRKYECKYFVASEYGSETHRPHYHLILLFQDNIKLLDAMQVVAESWKFGFVEVSSLNDNRVMYASKYVLKEDFWYEGIKGGVQPIAEFSKIRVENWDARKPFTLISHNFLPPQAVDFLNEYIYNGGNIRKNFEFSGKSFIFDTYIKRHIDPSLSAELQALYASCEDDVQERLLQSRIAHQKMVYDFGIEKYVNDYSKDKEILIHRERLKRCKSQLNIL